MKTILIHENRHAKAERIGQPRQWHLRVTSRNGNILCSSETYRDPRNVKKCWVTLMKFFSDAPQASTMIELAFELAGDARKEAAEIIKTSHYTHSVPAGKSHFLAFRNAIVVWSIPVVSR